MWRDLKGAISFYSINGLALFPNPMQFSLIQYLGGSVAYRHPQLCHFINHSTVVFGQTKTDTVNSHFIATNFGFFYQLTQAACLDMDFVQTYPTTSIATII